IGVPSLLGHGEYPGEFELVAGARRGGACVRNTRTTAGTRQLCRGSASTCPPRAKDVTISGLSRASTRGERPALDPERAAESAGRVVRFGPVVADENGRVTEIPEDGAAKLPDPG